MYVIRNNTQDILLFLHMFNALDETYIQDATDNSSYNAWSDTHSASDAEVFLLRYLQRPECSCAMIFWSRSVSTDD